MTFQEFSDMWTRKNLPIVLCPSEYYDDMFDKVDEINECKASVEDIIEYTIGAIIPYYSQYKESYLISKEWAEAEVTNFFVGSAISIVWMKGGRE